MTRVSRSAQRPAVGRVSFRPAGWLILASLLVALAAGGAIAAPPAPSPKLVVILVVDQMRADYVDRFSQQWSKGLHRLLVDGAWFRRAAYPYANTVTCVGHTTISTGALPLTHGIIANQWFDRESGRRVGCADDPGSSLISYAGAARGGYGPSRVMVPTLADELRAQLPGPTRVVTFSMKERTAIYLAGHRADAATWFNVAARGFVTSSAFTSAPVPFVAAFLAANPVEADFATPWTPALPAGRYIYDDAGTAEKPPSYWTAAFPHTLKPASDASGQEAYEAWEGSPFSDRYLGRLGSAAVDAMKLGQGRGTDFLAISFSALDLVGHDFGPNSHEVQDVLIRLDDTIGALLGHLDRVVGRGNYVVGFAADHGVAPIPEQESAKGIDAGRLKTAAVTGAAEAALQQAFGPGKYVMGVGQSDLTLSADALVKLRGNAEAREAVQRAVLAVPGVAKVYFADALGAAAATGDRDARAILLSYYPGRSGDLVVVPRAYWFFVSDDGTPQPGSATTHGSLYAYDQRVPVLLYGAGIKPGTYWETASPADLAPTLAALCGITLAKADGHVLSEALAAPAAASRAPAPVK